MGRRMDTLYVTGEMDGTRVSRNRKGIKSNDVLGRFAYQNAGVMKDILLYLLNIVGYNICGK